MVARAVRSSPPATRSRGLLAFGLPLPVAAAAGLATGLAPSLTLVVAGALVSALVLMSRLEWAALAVIGSAVFADYLAVVSPWATQWLAGVLVAAWLVRWRSHGRLHLLGLRRVLLPGGLFLLVVALAYAAHPHGRPGLTVWATYAGLVVVMLVLADCLCGPLAPRRAARSYVLSCVLAAGCGLVTAVLDERHRVMGPVADPDKLAFFLLAAVPLVGTVRTRGRQPVWWVWASLAVLMSAGVGTRSGAALVALIAMVAVAVAAGLLSLRHAGALLAVVTTAAALVLAIVPLWVGQAINDPQRYAGTDPIGRLDVSLATLGEIAASPLLGLGPGAAHGAAAHGTLLHAAAELGLLGVVALYSVWLVPARAARRRWLRDRSPLTAATLLAMTGLLTGSLLVPGQFLLPLWLLAAMTLALGLPAPPGRSGSGGSGRRSSGQVAGNW